MVNLAAFASGRGSNFKTILDRLVERGLPGRYVLLVSDRIHPPCEDIALAAGIPFVYLNSKAFSDPHQYALRLLKELESRQVHWITLAGYLKLIPAEVVQRYQRHILNIHPALLPLFGGAGMYGERVHKAVIESGMKVSGATVHVVDEEYDRGQIVLQDTVPVHFDDTPEALAHRVLEVEHRIYPLAVEYAISDRIKVYGRRVEILP
ncbi:MAG: phosphoribosylglycinamide formyltransferase [bacterium]|nr:phosphoribosylglycinamide formyltransferase [bacterium]